MTKHEVWLQFAVTALGKEGIRRNQDMWVSESAREIARLADELVNEFEVRFPKAFEKEQ